MAWAFHGFDGTGRNVKHSVNMPGVLQEKEGVGEEEWELPGRNCCPMFAHFDDGHDGTLLSHAPAQVAAL